MSRFCSERDLGKWVSSGKVNPLWSEDDLSLTKSSVNTLCLHWSGPLRSAAWVSPYVAATPLVVLPRAPELVCKSQILQITRLSECFFDRRAISVENAWFICVENDYYFPWTFFTFIVFISSVFMSVILLLPAMSGFILFCEALAHPVLKSAVWIKFIIILSLSLLHKDDTWHSRPHAL